MSTGNKETTSCGPNSPLAIPLYTFWHLYQIMNGKRVSPAMTKTHSPHHGLCWPRLFCHLATLIGHWRLFFVFGFVVMQKFCRVIGVIYSGIVKAEACTLCLSSFSLSRALNLCGPFGEKVAKQVTQPSQAGGRTEQSIVE